MFTPRLKLAEISADLPGRVFVFGDIHGSLEVLENGLNRVAEDDLVIFLGDYADRGDEGIEVVETVDRLIDSRPGSVIALKGNHEEYLPDGSPTFMPADLPREASEKRGNWQTYFQRFKNFTDKLYLSAVLPGYALFVHGGITAGIDGMEDLMDPVTNIREALLWSDPAGTDGERPNSRGIGTEFGPDITEYTLKRLGVEHIIRSHEPRKALHGPVCEQNGMIVTLNSTDVYGGDPFVLIIDPEDPPHTQEEFDTASVFL
ncbi:MAG: metallophosphoesterase family protein [Spirochaetia bacterium]